MNVHDLDLEPVRAMRAELPPPAPARLAAGRARLVAATARRPRSRPLVLIPAGVTALAAAAAIVVVVASSSGPAAHPVPPSATAAPTVRLTPAAEILYHASATVGAGHDREPHGDQWFYTKFTQYAYDQGTTTDEGWNRFDYAQDAYVLDGKLIVHRDRDLTTGRTPLERYDSNATPLTAYNALASLPSEPVALLRAVDARLALLGSDPGTITMAVPGSRPRAIPPTQGELEFGYLEQMLWNAAAGVPPAAEASVFRAMATIAGISIQQGVTDVVGRPAIALSVDGGVDQLLLDPTTYQVIGQRAISTGGHSHVLKGTTVPPAGTAILSMAWVQVTAVSRPGLR